MYKVCFGNDLTSPRIDRTTKRMKRNTKHNKSERSGYRVITHMSHMLRTQQAMRKSETDWCAHRKPAEEWKQCVCLKNDSYSAAAAAAATSAVVTSVNDDSWHCSSMTAEAYESVPLFPYMWIHLHCLLLSSTVRRVRIHLHTISLSIVFSIVVVVVSLSH